MMVFGAAMPSPCLTGFFMFLRCALLLLPLLLSGCERDFFASAPPIDEETYVMLIAEFELLQHATEVQEQQQRRTRGEDLPPEDLIDIAPEAVQREILRHYGVTEAELQKAHAYYSEDLEEQERRYREAIDRINEAHSRISAGPEDAE